ncbi:hypothetical protein ACOBV8_19920 (plasmid) [Pseudoalteromonas espejiana]
MVNARAGVGLIITGGISPNQEGILAPNRSVLDSIEGVEQIHVNYKGC